MTAAASPKGTMNAWSVGALGIGAMIWSDYIT